MPLEARPDTVAHLDPETVAFLDRWDRGRIIPNGGISSSLEAQETTPDPLEPSTTLDRSTGHPLELQSTFQRAAHSAFHTERWTVINALWQPEAPDELAKRAQRMGQCCCLPSLRLTAEGHVAPSLSRCRDRLCPLCASRRGQQAAWRTCSVVAKFNAPRFLTLTLAHRQETLREMFTRLHAYIKELRDQHFWRKAVWGGIFGFEVTRNTKTGSWHCHVHAIIDGEFMPQAVLKAAWQKITGDSFIVDIRAIPDRHKAARYISRYVAKPIDCSAWLPADLREYATAMHGRRLLQTFGNAHNVKADDDIETEPSAGSSHLCTAQQLREALTAGDPGAERATKLLARMGRDYAPIVGVTWAYGDIVTVPEPEEQAWLIDTLRRIGDPFPAPGARGVVIAPSPDGLSEHPPDTDLPW